VSAIGCCSGTGVRRRSKVRLTASASVTRSNSKQPAILADRVERAVAPAQEIEVERGPVGALRPEPQQHRALEHEAVASIGDGEPIEKALETVAREHGLVVVTRVPGPVQ
jgi:hypothetical protein